MPARPPSVDSLARSLADTGLPHPLLVEIARSAIADGSSDVEGIEPVARHRAAGLQQSMLQPVINATGVLLHTNMGRAPFGSSTEATYSNLELDLASGQRGSRQAAVGNLFAQLCGAEAAIVVNNCAAAVTLSLAGLAVGRGVAVSRSELVEIGGGFRVPEVLEQSGAHLVEVGTTNRTRRADYENAVASDRDVAVALKVHQSNYKIVGFTEQVEVRELKDLGVAVLADIGSGLLDASCPWLSTPPPSWLVDEPAAKQTIADGAGLVMFSGDKLLGGPQAGIIAGNRELVEKCARHPLARAFRPGGLILTQLQNLALAYLRRDGMAIPFWRMATAGIDDLHQRAAAIGQGQPVDLMSVPGGGTLPTVEIPSAGVALDGDQSTYLRTAGNRPVIARVTDGQTFLDMRTVDPSDDAYISSLLAGRS